MGGDIWSFFDWPVAKEGGAVALLNSSFCGRSAPERRERPRSARRSCGRGTMIVEVAKMKTNKTCLQQAEEKKSNSPSLQRSIGELSAI